MKLPEVLKKGILEGDWQIICTAYTAMTGEHIDPPEPKQPNWLDFDIELGSATRITPVDENGLPGIAVKINEVKDDASDKTLVEEEWVETDGSNFTGDLEGKQARREPIKTDDDRPNKFKDNPGVYKKERVDINPTMGAIRQPRPKKAASLVTVQCSICDKKENVSRALSAKYSPDPEKNTYRCNSCCSSRGG
jgi:hypothetical protein